MLLGLLRMLGMWHSSECPSWSAMVGSDGRLWTYLGVFLAALGSTRGARTNVVAEVPTLDVGPVVVVRVAEGSTARLPCRHPHYPDDNLNLVLWYLNHSKRPFLSYDARSLKKDDDGSKNAIGSSHSRGEKDIHRDTQSDNSVESQKSEGAKDSSEVNDILPTKEKNINDSEVNNEKGELSLKRLTRSVPKDSPNSRKQLSCEGTSLVIRNVGETDEAEYRCRVHYRLNPTWTQRLKLVIAGESENLTIEDAAGRPLEAQVGPLTEGANLTLTCTASHNISIVESLWWLHDGVVLDTSWSSSDDEEVVVNHLSIASLEETFRDAVLTCQLITTDEDDPHIAANITERSITIAMFFVPEAVMKSDGGREVSGGGLELTEGQTLSFHCSVRADPPVYNLTWLHNGRMMSVGGRVWARDNSSLVISPVDRRDTGLYACLASNSEGDGHSNAIPVVVNHAPYCLGPPHRKVVVAVNTSISLDCRVAAQPQDLTFSWKIGVSSPSLSHSQSVMYPRTNNNNNPSFPDTLQRQDFERNYDRPMWTTQRASTQLNDIIYNTEPYVDLQYDLSGKNENLDQREKPRHFSSSFVNFDSITHNAIDPKGGPGGHGVLDWEGVWSQVLDGDQERDDQADLHQQRQDPKQPDTSTVTLTPYASTVVGCFARNSVGHIKVPCTYTLTVVEPPKPLRDCNITLVGITKMEVRCEDPVRPQETSAMSTDPALQDAQHSPSMSFVRSPEASSKANLEVWSGDTLVANVSEVKPIFSVRGLPPDAQLRLVLYTVTPHSRSTSLHMYAKTQPQRHVHISVPRASTARPPHSEDEESFEIGPSLLERIDWRLGGIVGGVGVMVIALVVGVVMWAWEKLSPPPECPLTPVPQMQHYRGITLETLASESSFSDLPSVVCGTSPLTSPQSTMQVKACGEDHEGIASFNI